MQPAPVAHPPQLFVRSAPLAENSTTRHWQDARLHQASRDLHVASSESSMKQAAMVKPAETAHQMAPAEGLPRLDSVPRKALLAVMVLLAEMPWVAASALAMLAMLTMMMGMMGMMGMTVVVFVSQVARWVAVHARNIRQLKQLPGPHRPSIKGWATGVGPRESHSSNVSSRVAVSVQNFINRGLRSLALGGPGSLTLTSVRTDAV